MGNTVDKTRLVGAAKLLNGAVYTKEDGEKAPVLETKIKVVAVKDDVLRAAFISACGAVIAQIEAGTLSEDVIDDEIANVYNALTAPEMAEAVIAQVEDEKAETEKPEDADAPVATETKKLKTKKERKESTGTRKAPERAKDGFGNVVGTMSATINAALAKGTRKEDLVAEIIKTHGRTADAAEAKIKTHIQHLKKNGHEVTTNEKSGVMQIAKKKGE